MANHASIDLERLNCVGCPARGLLDIDGARKAESLRACELGRMGGEPGVILLGESAPAKRFVYDLNSDYSRGGVRFNLRQQLLPGGGPEEALLEVLRRRRIWIVDGALCPLHLLPDYRNRRGAVTQCLREHTKRPHIDAFRNARLLTFFPEHCGFLKRGLPSLQERVEKALPFDLKGLAQILDRPPVQPQSERSSMSICIHGLDERFCAECLRVREAASLHVTAVRLTPDGSHVIVLRPADSRGTTVMRLRDDSAEIVRIAEAGLGAAMWPGPELRAVLEQFRAGALDLGHLFEPAQPLEARESTEEGAPRCHTCRSPLGFQEKSLGCRQCRYYVCRCGLCLCGYTGVNYRGELFRQYPPLSIERSARVDCIRVVGLCAVLG